MSQVAVKGQIWNYEEIGTGEKISPLLVLHGWGRSGNEWVNMAKELSEWSGRKVYVLDLPGFGGSSLPHVKTIFEYSELVRDFCRYMAIERVMVLGHSLGGRIGIILGAKHPDLVERLILVDPAGVRPKSIRRTVLLATSSLFSWMPKSLRRVIVKPIMDDDYLNSVVLRDLYRVVVSADLRNYLREIQCQTWVIWGEHDPILPISLTDIYKTLLPHPVVRVIWGALHDPHLSHYTELRRVLEEAVWTCE